jgi:hypothetical protein
LGIAALDKRLFSDESIHVVGETIRLTLSDTVRQDKFAAKSTFIFGDATWCIIRYSVAETPDAKSSFAPVDTFIKRYHDLNQSGFVVIAANISDTLLCDEEELPKLAELTSKHKELVRKTFLMSAKFVRNIKEMFNVFANELLLSSQATFTMSARLQISHATKEESGCC